MSEDTTQSTGEAARAPDVADIVWYFSYGTPGGEFPGRIARAAIVTEVDRPGDPSSPVGLAVLNPTGMFFNQHVRRATEPRQAGHWDWPSAAARGGPVQAGALYTVGETGPHLIVPSPESLATEA